MKKLLLSSVSVLAFVSAATAQADNLENTQYAEKNGVTVNLDNDVVKANLDIKDVIARQVKVTLDQGKAKYLTDIQLAYQPAKVATKPQTSAGE
ncbi:hypothetical protein [Salinimonas chungwhensis]|uniref:hypothetical protein n=1 Tax=Salinimonas chungwhensis TaxID=265425 RepID=UPI000365C405|nr:hypothetical protein [Salinimonas chungwhensis]